MKCDNLHHAQQWEIIDHRGDRKRIFCDQCQEDWWTGDEDPEEEETPEEDDEQPPPAPRPTRPPQWWIDNNTDGMGNCFSDADEGL